MLRLTCYVAFQSERFETSFRTLPWHPLSHFFTICLVKIKACDFPFSRYVTILSMSMDTQKFASMMINHIRVSAEFDHAEKQL